MPGVLQNFTIMVVDDNEDTRDLLRLVLEQEGASVVVKESVADAIESFSRTPPHAVVTDIRLGTSDGYALLKAIRERNVEYRGFTPAVAVTGFASPEDEERAMAAGFNAYLAKPFDPRTVVFTIRRILPGSVDLAA
jgi:CheY-like chemotaxis protein